MKPLKVEITGRDKILSAGKKYETRCQSTGSKPPAVLTWWKASKQLKRTIRNVSTELCVSLFLKKKKKRENTLLTFPLEPEPIEKRGTIEINNKRIKRFSQKLSSSPQRNENNDISGI